MTTEYELCYRDAKAAVQNILANPGFKTEFDYAPYREYTAGTGTGGRVYRNVMSGNWAWKQAVSSSYDYAAFIIDENKEYNCTGPIYPRQHVRTGDMR